MNSLQSLDQRYLAFREKTKGVFDRFPQIEPLRYFIFKELLIEPRRLGWREHVKHWISPFVRQERTVGSLSKTCILIWIESAREIISQTLFPVFEELVKRGEHVCLVSLKGPSTLPPTTVQFRFRPGCFAPEWGDSAWRALCDAEKPIDRPESARMFRYACANVQSLLSEFRRIFELIQPRVVVAASTQQIGGAGAFVTAQGMGIRTVLLQHGLLQPFHIPIVADTICTWGQSFNKTLAGLGIDQHRMVALGSPRHDRMMPSINGRARRALVNSLDLEDKFTLAFFSNGNDLLRNGSAPLECADWLESLARQYQNRINVIVRLHPNEDGSLYRSCPHLIVLRDPPSLDLVLEGCDCVASLCSTALFEGLLYYKPILQLLADGWPDLADNWKQGLAQRVRSKSEFAEAVEHMLNAEEPSCNDTARVESVFANRGRATQAVAEFIVSQTKMRPEAKTNSCASR